MKILVWYHSPLMEQVVNTLQMDGGGLRMVVEAQGGAREQVTRSQYSMAVVDLRWPNEH
jgi:hypothetical protein